MGMLAKNFFDRTQLSPYPTMVALIMLLMMLAEYVDPSEILRSSKHHMVIIEG